MSEEKKIIVDEDWKSQVEAEKQAAERESAPEQPAVESGQSSIPSDLQFPPASFDLLLTTLATEALVALGQMPHPVTGKAEPHRHHAKYLIDTIDVLREKTKGNLSPDEQQAIDGLLHQLRMAFIATESPSA
jgi:Domain of unknown function (DUF1844)